jgi:hypothetical protein
MAIHHAPAPRPVVERGHGPVVRDHREAARPAVRREPVRIEHREPIRWQHRDRDDRRVIIQRPVYVAPVTTAVWTPSAAYTYQPQPIQLLAPTALADEPLTLSVGSLGAATSLELDSAGGTTYVSQVLLVDASGYTQTVPVNQVLSPQNPTIQLPISTQISQIVIEGHSDWGGQLSLRAF